MTKLISSVKLASTLTLSEQTDGFWLYDTTQEMNLSMRSETSTAALVDAVMYYQRRLIDVERKYASLQKKVDTFVGQFVDTSDIDF